MTDDRAEDDDVTAGGAALRLRVLLPTGVLVDAPATSVVAEGADGFFGLRPRHVDLVAALVPSVLSYRDAGGAERFVGHDEGLLVKCGADLRVSVRNAVLGAELGRLRDEVRRRFVELDERERSGRSALARLEAGVVRRFVDL